MSKIKEWLNPPQFEDDNKTRTANFLHYLLLSVLLLLGIYLIFLIVSDFGIFETSAVQILSVLWLILLGLEIATKRGYVKQASIIFVISGWLALNLQAWKSTGIYDTAFYASFLVILIAGLLLGWRIAVILTGLTIAFGFYLAYAETNGLIHYSPGSPYSIIRDLTLIWILSVLVLSLAISSMENAIKRSKISEKSLADANEELRKVQEGLETHVAEQTRDLTLAAELSQDISQIRDVDELLITAVERIRSHFDLYYAQIYLISEDGTQLNLSAGTGLVGEALLNKGHQLSIDTKSINGQAALENRAIIVADTAQSLLFRPNPSLPYTRSELAIPLTVGDKVLGVIDLQSITPNSFNEDNLSAFETLAGQLAVTIENAALFRAQERLTQELQKSTQKFQENETFLDSILENLPISLFVKDAQDLRYLRINKAAIEFMGIPLEATINKTDYDIFPEAQAAYFTKQTQKVLDSKQTHITVDVIKTSQGEVFVQARIIPILDTNGNPLYLIGITQDITEQREAERMLNERIKELNLVNEIGRKADEQPSLEEFLTYIVNRIPAGMQHSDLCKVAITLGDEVYGDPEAINLPSHIVEGLRLEGEQIGRIYIAYTEKQDFLNEESALVGSIGRRVTDYIANRRLLDRVQATVEGLQTVAEVGTAITSQQDPQQLLQNVVDLTKTQFDFYHAHIYLYDEMIDALVLSAGAGDIGRQMVNESRQIPLSAPRSLVARAAREKRGQVVADVEKEPGFLPHPLLPETRSEMAVPLAVGDQLIGVLDIQSSEVNGFTPEDVNIQTTLASQIAVALQNAEQYEQTQAALDEVNALQRALTREGWQAYLTATDRPIQGYQTSQNELQPIQKEEKAGTNGSNDRITFPISVRGTAIGHLGINAADKQPDPDDLVLLEAISTQVAEALERARLFEETEVARSQTEALFTGSENVVRSTTLDDILKSLVEATALKNTDRASIAFFNRPWQETNPESLTVFATWQKETSGPLVEAGTTFAFDTYPIAKFLQREEPFVVDDFTIDPRMDENSKRLFVDGLGMRSAIVIPLVTGGQWIGFVLALSTNVYKMTESDIRQTMSLAGQAATVAQSQRLYQEAQSKAQREQILREVSAKVSAAVDAESVLQTATREIGRALGLETFVYLKKSQPDQ